MTPLTDDEMEALGLEGGWGERGGESGWSDSGTEGGAGEAGTESSDSSRYEGWDD